METRKKWIVLLLCAMLLLLEASEKTWAYEAPYQPYTLDKWGNATPAPNGYLPVRSINGNELGCGNFSNAADMFYCGARGEIYIVDSGNARILVLDDKFGLKKQYKTLTLKDNSEYAFSNPQGIYVLSDGTMYIAEMGNQEVVVCDEGGHVRQILGEPTSTLLPDNFNYLPSKIVADGYGRLYILSQGIYQGLIYMEADGTFIKFFGANEVEMTLKRQMMKLWKNILSDEAAATMQSFNPIEYGNIFMGQDGYIYATAAGSEQGSKLLTKLNPLGINTLPFAFNGTVRYTDVTVNEDGIITLLDTQFGNIIQIDENGKQMFAFGGLGDQVGLFRRPVSMIEVNGNLYVMDADKNTITEFSLTQFGDIVQKAIVLYNKGLYEESIGSWEEVVRHNSNYLLAYTGLGKAYYQLEDYDTAMYYYRLGNDRENYSYAFKEASLKQVRDAFGGIVLGIVLLAVAVTALKKYRKKRKGAGAWAN